MADATTLDRCLWDVTGLAREKWVTVGDNAHGGRARVAAAGSISGYRWLGSRLAPIDCLPCSEFSATRWEQRSSVLNPDRTGSLKFAPVVSDKSLVSFSFPITGSQAAFPIVAHYGTVSVDEIIVPRKFATGLVSRERRAALERLLDQDIKAYVEQGYPDAGDWGPFSDINNIGPNKFTVLTDPEGLILACLDAFGSEPGLESEDPISYLMLAPALLELVKVGGRVVWRLASQRAARKAAARALAGEFETLTLEELETIRGGGPTRPLTRNQVDKAIELLRNGQDVHVESIVQMRQIQSELGQLGVRSEGSSTIIPQRPATSAFGSDPAAPELPGSFQDGRGTYRVDPAHNPGAVPYNPHSEYPHINITLPNGKTLAVVVTGSKSF